MCCYRYIGSAVAVDEQHSGDDDDIATTRTVSSATFVE